MSTERWNDDIAYVFSIHKYSYEYTACGHCKRRRYSRGYDGIMMIPFLMLDLIYNQNANTGIEDILLSVGVMLVIMKHLCIGLSQKKLNININGAIDDWLVLTLMLLYSTFACVFAYVLVILFINLKQIFFTDSNLLDANTTNWILLLPCGPLSKSITGSQYVIILTIQLCSNGHGVFARGAQKQISDIRKQAKHRGKLSKKVIRLINRHSKLMEFYQNLEDSFNLCILIELVTVTIVLAFIEFSSCKLILIESLVLTYAGDFLQRESEGIFYAIYATSWFTLPLTLMKDMHFAMMKSSIPFRFTGGKFFYVNRETMMNILKTAASYVSVLRIALVKLIRMNMQCVHVNI
ncbi:Odorant receptor 384 [Nylanderia fulva]|uniref:Odorant receptor n=1 Tax=Nylanderia fulva TaxID=613905 RepID=A0A6G1LQ75_9HYME|nr:Odorant receptor 384 [Nylanderia fulva]